MKFNKEKFKNVLHYIISKCGNEKNVGKTVLYKLLYFSDFNYFELYETYMTKETCIKYPHGPAPKHFDYAINELIIEDKIETKEKTIWLNRKMYKYSSLKKPSNNLEKKELDVINNVIKKLSNMTANKISKYSHGDMPWRVAEDYGEIEYPYVFYRDPEYVVREYNGTD